MSLLQHHDGITGTAKQHVVNDYHKRVYKGGKWQNGGREAGWVGVLSTGFVVVCTSVRSGWQHAATRPRSKAVSTPLSLSAPAGMKEAQQVVTSALEALIRGEYTPGGGPGAWAGAADGLLAGATSPPDVYAASSQQRRRLQQAPSPVDVRVQLDACDWLNITACNATGAASGSI